MPRFKYRNLLIDVLPEAGARQQRDELDCDLYASCGWTMCLGCTGALTQACFNTQCGGCTFNISAPPPCDWHCTQVPSGTCFPCTNLTEIHPKRAEPRDLARLKERLRDALAEVEERERELSARLRPRSVSEAEALESQLREALSEIQAEKDELRRRSQSDDR